MKKLIAMLLTSSMIFSMTATAFASTDESDATYVKENGKKKEAMNGSDLTLTWQLLLQKALVWK